MKRKMGMWRRGDAKSVLSRRKHPMCGRRIPGRTDGDELSMTAVMSRLWGYR